MIHQLKERKGQDVLAKCGAKVTIAQTTAWASDVTCRDCKPPKRLVRRKK